MNNITVRTWTAEERAVVLDMNNAAVPAVNAHTRESLVELEEQAAHTVVAEIDGVIAGFLLLLDGPGRDYDSLNYRWFCERYESLLYVDRIVIGEQSRGLGVGRHLYQWAVAAGRGRWPVLCAEVNIKPRNDGSLAFHDSLGFEAVGEQDTEGGAKRVVLLARPLV